MGVTLPEGFPEPVATFRLDHSQDSTVSPLLKHNLEVLHNNPQLQPTFYPTYDKSWTSQSCMLDAVGEYPEGHPIREWHFNGLKTISPVHATVRFSCLNLTVCLLGLGGCAEGV